MYEFIHKYKNVVKKYCLLEVVFQCTRMVSWNNYFLLLKKQELLHFLCYKGVQCVIRSTNLSWVSSFSATQAWMIATPPCVDEKSSRSRNQWNIFCVMTLRREPEHASLKKKEKGRGRKAKEIWDKKVISNGRDMKSLGQILVVPEKKESPIAK